MSLPPLRQPKLQNTKRNNSSKVGTFFSHEDQYVILTIKEEKKLVVSSNYYHGLIKQEDNNMKCIFCDNIPVESNMKKLDNHKHSLSHFKNAKIYPHLEDFGENLIRKIKNEYYCTLCNVLIASTLLNIHMRNDVHKAQLSKAILKATVYKAASL